jgi:hypothetical protein
MNGSPGRPRIKPGVYTHLTSVSLPVDLLTDARRVAQADGRSVSGLVRHALTRYVQDFDRLEASRA